MGPTSSRPLGIYIHIPFCRRRCRYCDFLSHGGAEAVPETYIEAVQREWRLWAAALDPAAYTVQSIYFGGGTPSLMDPGQVGALVSAIRGCLPVSADCEITLEGNPDSLSLDSMQRYGESGVNRLSVGVQSFHDPSLHSLGRLHDAATAVRTLREARRAGIHNLSLDLMYGLPGSSTALELDSLKQAVALAPQHISWYNLTLAEGTALAQSVEQGETIMPADDEIVATMQAGWKLLDSCGYEHYEISNFGLPGFASRHNLAYWLFTDYVGLGLGASGFLDGRRWTNVSSLQEYCSCIAAGRYPVETEERLQGRRREGEYAMLRMRLPILGLQFPDFSHRFGEDAREVFRKELTWLEQNQLVTLFPDRVVCTRRGLELNNVVAEKFICDETAIPAEKTSAGITEMGVRNRTQCETLKRK